MPGSLAIALLNRGSNLRAEDPFGNFAPAALNLFTVAERPELSAVTPMICLGVTTLGAIGFVMMSRGYRSAPPTRPAGAPEPAAPVRASE